MPTVSIYIWFIFHLESVTWQLRQTRACFFQGSIMSVIYFFSNNLWDPRGKKCSALWSYYVNVFALKKKKKYKWVIYCSQGSTSDFSPSYSKSQSFLFLKKKRMGNCYSRANFHAIFSFFLCSGINAIHSLVIYTQCKT